MEWLKVVDNNGTIREKWEVLVHNGGERFSVFTPCRVKHYKNLKSVEKFLSQYELTIA